jgi:hypothetical protein
MSKTFLDLALKISEYYPVSRVDGDEELKDAIGEVHLGWACLELSPYIQMTTFYIAPNATVDVVFGQNTESLQKGPFSWPAAISNGKMRAFKPECEGSVILSHHVELNKCFKKSGSISFQQGIKNGTLIPVDADIDDDHEALRRPSIADLEKHYHQGLKMNSNGEPPPSATDVQPSHESDATNHDQPLRVPESVQYYPATNLQLPSDQTQRMVEDWVERCEGYKATQEDQPTDNIGFEGAPQSPALDRPEQSSSAKPLDLRDALKTRRPDYGEESTNKRRRSGVMDNLVADEFLSSVNASISPRDSFETSQNTGETDHLTITSFDSHAFEPFDSVRSTKGSHKTRNHSSKVKDESSSPRRRQRGTSRSKRSGSKSEKRPRDPSTSNTCDFSAQGAGYGDYSFEPELNLIEAPLPNNIALDEGGRLCPYVPWQSDTSTYTLEHTSRNETLTSATQINPHCIIPSNHQKRQSLPATPRSHHFAAGDFNHTIRARAMSIPGVVIEAEPEMGETPTVWPYRNDSETQNDPASWTDTHYQAIPDLL